MANARAYASPAVVRRYVDLAKAMGLDVGGFEVGPDGTVRVLPKPPAPVDEVDRWLNKM